LIPELLKHLPNWPCHLLRWKGTYFEPFVGGGAMFFAVGAGRSVLYDTNTELINCMQMVQSDLPMVVIHLEGMTHAEEKYYEVRKKDRDIDWPGAFTPAYRAARFIYLNKTGYNGLWRENSKGQNNVPFGKYKNPTIIDRENLAACSLAFKGTTIEAASFEKVLEHAVPGDFVYFDPPYDVLSPTANFTSYTPGGFGWEEQLLLRQCCEELEKKGVSFLLSNADTERINVLYGGKFFIRKVQSPRAINSKSEKRGMAKEVLIYNREVEGVV
jgi:DNA adenine methylase